LNKVIIIFLSLMISVFSFAGGVKNKKFYLSKKNKLILGQIAFTSFINCKKFRANGSLTNKRYTNCMSRFLTGDASKEYFIKKYSFLHSRGINFDKLSHCSKKRERFVRHQNDNGKLFLCFNYKFNQKKDFNALIFFKKNSGQLKISKIKL